MNENKYFDLNQSLGLGNSSLDLLNKYNQMNNSSFNNSVNLNHVSNCILNDINYQNSQNRTNNNINNINNANMVLGAVTSGGASIPFDIIGNAIGGANEQFSNRSDTHKYIRAVTGITSTALCAGNLIAPGNPVSVAGCYTAGALIASEIAELKYHSLHMTDPFTGKVNPQMRDDYIKKNNPSYEFTPSYQPTPVYQVPGCNVNSSKIDTMNALLDHMKKGK
jgi:hypothetical protein